MKYLILLFIVLPSWAGATSVDVILKNNKALKELGLEHKTEAYEILSRTLVDHPSEAALNYNLGQILETNEEKEKALQLYSVASKTADDPELKFNSLFNAARVAGDLKKRDEALKFYQDALDIKPDSIEVKTNIELLMSSSGGGGGDNQDQKKNKQDGNGDQSKQPQPQDDQNKKDEPKSKPKPQPFQSKELNQQDVKKILDELKRQEEGVRAKFNDRYRKETPVEKDW